MLVSQFAAFPYGLLKQHAKRPWHANNDGVKTLQYVAIGTRRLDPHAKEKKEQSAGPTDGVRS